MEFYKVKLRDEMPRGFIKNERIPELPAINNYLKQYDGNLTTKEEFETILENFPEYLINEKIPEGIDGDVRRGLFLYKQYQQYVIFCFNDSLSGRCEFGSLEKIMEK